MYRAQVTVSRGIFNKNRGLPTECRGLHTEGFCLQRVTPPPHREQTDASGKTLTSLAVDKDKIHTHFFLVTDELNRNGSSIHKTMV